MDYIGSKEKLTDWLFSIFSKQTFLDGCAGSGSVSRYAAKKGYNVIAVDVFAYSCAIIEGSLCTDNDHLIQAQKHITIMNALKPVKGFFYNNFSEHSKRLYFSDLNACKIDACRQYVNTIKNQIIKNYLLYCMVEALTRVANTTGVQAAFLKKLKQRALQDFIIKPEPTYYSKNVKVYQGDLSILLSDPTFKHTENILYIDPPYNQRQYGPNYHLYETLIRYDNPELKGMTGIRKNWQKESKSDFCSRKTFFIIFSKILKYTTANKIFLSYSSDGLMSKQEIMNWLKIKYLNVICHEKSQRRYKADTDESREYNTENLYEYLFEFSHRRIRIPLKRIPLLKRIPVK